MVVSWRCNVGVTALTVALVMTMIPAAYAQSHEATEFWAALKTFLCAHYSPADAKRLQNEFEKVWGQSGSCCCMGAHAPLCLLCGGTHTRSLAGAFRVPGPIVHRGCGRPCHRV